MHDSVTISHRGSRHEIGSGRGFFGIWRADEASGGQRHLVEWWPASPEGWHGAWSRFTSIEDPASIVPAGQGGPTPTTPGAAAPRPVTGPRGLVAPALLAVGVVIGVAGLFPAYLGGASLASQAVEFVPHLIYLAGWAAGAVLLLWRGAAWRSAAGALVAVGVSAVTFGLLFADLGTVIAAPSAIGGAGLALSLIGWLVCSAGAVFAVLSARPGSPRRLASLQGTLVFALTAFAALGAAIAFAPSWDSYTFRTPTAGVLQTLTAGNAFANPAPVIAADVAVMAVLVAVVVIAALWQPVKLGAALLAGATIPLVGQAISALVQIQSPVSPAQFGISPGQASQTGLTISPGLTPAFWVYCGFVLALGLIAARMLTSPGAEPPAPAPAPISPVTAGAGAGPSPGRTL